MKAKLAERRQNARRKIERGNALAARGKAELDECDRFEAFYDATMSEANLVKPFLTASELSQPDFLKESIARAVTLKAAILQILQHHPPGLESNELLHALHRTGFADLPRTTMSPQLSRLRASGDITNEDGRWKIKTNEAAG